MTTRLHRLFAPRARTGDLRYGTILSETSHDLAMMLLCPSLTYFNERGWACLVVRTGDRSGEGAVIHQPMRYLLTLVRVEQL